MDKPFKLEIIGRDPTPEEAEWIRRAEAIMNHPENAEPILERMNREMSHYLSFGHFPEYNGDGLALCFVCNIPW